MANSGWRYGTASGDSARQWSGNASTLDRNSNIPENFNVVLYGPDGVVKIAVGVTIHIGDGAVVKIKDINAV